MSFTHEQIFKQHYAQVLSAAITKSPEEYMYGHEQIPTVVDRMYNAINRGRFSFQTSPSLRTVCRALGIPVTQKALMEYIHDTD